MGDTSNKYNWQRVNIQKVLSLHITEKNDNPVEKSARNFSGYFTKDDIQWPINP